MTIPTNSHCEMCGDSGVVQVERIEYVTRDMAIDAGAPEMEGQPQPQGFEDVPCPACSSDLRYRCTCCHVNFVDSDAGYDTCSKCLASV